MISVKNILTISSYESKVLWRNWFFRIVALLGIFFITIFNLAEFSELDTPDWRLLSNGAVLPYSTLILISIPQVAAVVFLATGLIKKDKKLDTNEVFFVRPISNLDYVFGKALALFKLFFLLNIVLLSIPFIVGLTSPFANIDPKAFMLYPLLTSVPSIVFTTGIAFLLVTIIRNQPIAIVLLIGVAGVQLIYYFDKFSNIHDFTGFRLSMLASEITGFVDIQFAVWQRFFFFLTGIGFLFLTAFLLDRLASHRATQRTTLFIGVVLLSVASFIMVNLWNMRQEPIALREEMIAVNGKWASVPNIRILSHALDVHWTGNEISTVSELIVTNGSSVPLGTIYFSLNPGLTVDKVTVDGKTSSFNRELQILSITEGVAVAPEQNIKLTIQYHGSINEAAAHLEVDQKRYEQMNEYIVFGPKKKYGFLQEDYVLLTNDLFWYPDTQVGFNRKAATTPALSFIDFTMTVHVPPGKTAISQGKASVKDNVFQFTPEYPLPQISLVIGDYAKKHIAVDGIEYAVFHHPNNDFFVKHLNLLSDTLGHLVTDIVDEYEDAQKIKYPFKRLQFVEVPLHFTGYNKIYQSAQAYLQPETVFWPEQGGEIDQFDFRSQLKLMNQQAAKANQVLTEKQKQANIFNDLIKKVFTKQIGSTWTWDGKDVDKPDYSLFPNYYDFNSGIVSEDWPLLNRSIATYLRNDKQKQNDYSREIKGISFTEECNDLMRTSSINEILTEAEFNQISKSVSLKSQYLFSYLGYTLGETNFKSFLYAWVNRHPHELNSYATFRQAMISKFNVDPDPIIQSVYAEVSQPAFEILDVQKYEVMDGDRKRYQVLVTARNAGASDGVIEVQFNAKNAGDDDDYYYYAKVNEAVAEEAPGQVSVIQKGQTKLFGFMLDEKPTNLTINTIISQNIPSVISIPIATLSKGDQSVLFQGERVLHHDSSFNRYEVIVDNEDRGFTTFSPIKPTMLKAYLDNHNKKDQKYFGIWSGSYSNWRPTTGSDYYGTVVRSAHFTRSGNGEKIATWAADLHEDGFYDIYVHMKGKNQNEFVGRDRENKEFTYHYIVKNADGTDNIVFNISNAEPGWNYLGSYYFNKSGGSISLTDECDLRTVYADAVKWVKQ